MSADWRIAVDIGGTFTDVVLVDLASGAVVVDKTLTTHGNPLDAVRTGLRSLMIRAGIEPGDVTAPIVHATTLITNALIEGKTGRAAMVTTVGFGDTLLIRDEHRYDMYDLQIEFPAPPIPRERTFELAERVAATGEVSVLPGDHMGAQFGNETGWVSAIGGVEHKLAAADRLGADVLFVPEANGYEFDDEVAATGAELKIVAVSTVMDAVVELCDLSRTSPCEDVLALFGRQ